MAKRGRPDRASRFASAALRDLWRELPVDMQSRILRLHELVGRYAEAPSLEELVRLWAHQCPLDEVQARCAVSGVPLKYKGPCEPKLWKLHYDRGWTPENMVFVSRLMYEMIRLWKAPMDSFLEETIEDIQAVAEGLRHRPDLMDPAGRARALAAREGPQTGDPSDDEDPDIYSDIENPWSGV